MADAEQAEDVLKSRPLKVKLTPAEFTKIEKIYNATLKMQGNITPFYENDSVKRLHLVAIQADAQAILDGVTAILEAHQ